MAAPNRPRSRRRHHRVRSRPGCWNSAEFKTDYETRGANRREDLGAVVSKDKFSVAWRWRGGPESRVSSGWLLWVVAGIFCQDLAGFIVAASAEKEVGKAVSGLRAVGREFNAKAVSLLGFGVVVVVGKKIRLRCRHLRVGHAGPGAV